jgi:hypothetical protein
MALVRVEGEALVDTGLTILVAPTVSHPCL